MKTTNASIYAQNKMPQNWKSYIDDLIARNEGELHSSSIIKIRKIIKGHIESEMQDLINKGNDHYYAINKTRIKDIYAYTHNLKIWPFYGYGTNQCVDNLGSLPPFPNTKFIEGTKDIALLYREIKAELDLVKRKLNTDTKEPIYIGTWRSILLWDAMKYRSTAAGQFFKYTIEALLCLPLFRRVYNWAQESEGFRGYQVRISLLKSNSTILPHFGITNTRLRLQIPIEVPEGDLYIYSHNQTRHWIIGEPIILNDAYIHGVRNYSHGDRIILLVDLPHPDATLEQLMSIQDI